jgi:competence protein ComEC
MKLLDFIPVKLTLFLVLGILIGYQINISLFISAAITGVLIVLLGITWTRKKKLENLPFGILALLCTIGLGMLAIALTLPDNNTKHYSGFKLSTDPYFLLKFREILKPNDFNDRYIVEVSAIDSTPAKGRILLIVKKDTLSHKFNVDDEIYTLKLPELIRPPLNPYEFDYAAYLKKTGVNHQLKLGSWDYIIKKDASRSLSGLTEVVRQRIISGLGTSNFGGEEFAIIQALLLGQRNSIGTDTYNNYRNAGAVHILAVSGLHIGIVLLLCQFLLSPLERLPRGRIIVLILTVILLWGYALLAGLSPSVIRAVCMFSFAAYAVYLNRPTSSFNILALSMFFILLVYDPMLLFQVGFQLSYAAVFAIFWLFPKLQRFWNPENFILKKVWQLISVSLAAQIGVLPISLFYFHQFPGLFFISNLLIIPFLGLILGMGFLIIFLMLADLLPSIISNIYNEIIHLMNKIIEWTAKQESFIFKDIPFDPMQLVLCYLLILALVYFVIYKKFKNILASALCVIALQLWAGFSVVSKSREQKIFVLHKTGTSALIYKKANTLSVHCSDSASVVKLVNNFVVAENIRKLNYISLKNSYLIKGQGLLIINNPETSFLKLLQTKYVLLGNSPKINFNRFLDSTQPKSIIVDGSNYKSDIKRWKKSCSDRKIPFHYTGEKGAFVLDIE